MPRDLQDVEDPVVLAVALRGLDEQPGVDQRRQSAGRRRRRRLGVQAGEEGRDSAALEEVDLSGEHGGHVRRRSRPAGGRRPGP